MWSNGSRYSDVQFVTVPLNHLPYAELYTHKKTYINTLKTYVIDKYYILINYKIINKILKINKII